MLFKNIDIIDEHFDHKRHCYVGVLGDTIAYVSDTCPPDAHRYGEAIDGEGKVLMPGLVNAHCHCALTLLRGYAENLPLADWLNQAIFPFEAHLDDAAIYDGTMLACGELLRFGVTSVSDMYFRGEANCRAAMETKIKMNVGIHDTRCDPRGIRQLPVYTEWKQLIPRYHNAENGRLRLDLAIHAEYTTTPRIARETAELAREWGLRLQLHLSETKAEQQECKQRHNGLTPAQYFNSLQVFDAPTTAAHGVWLEGEDFDILREKGVTVASCPVSNCKLASGFAPTAEILKRGINLALGTDSVASNNNLNLFEELKFLGTIYKAASGDATAISPKQALFAATRGGALSQGRTDTGVIKVGCKADLVMLDVKNQPHLHPCHHLLNNLVFSAVGSEVVLTMVDGAVLYRNGEYTTLDMERCIHNAEASFRRVKNQVEK